MNLADLKEKFLESLKETSTKLSENETVIRLGESYRNLSPMMQKVLTGFVIFIFGYLIYSVPASFLDAAAEAEENFALNRSLIRGLYRSARNPTISADQFKGLEFEEMKTSVDGVLTNTQVIDTQKTGYVPVPRPLVSKNAPAAIKQTGMSFEIKKLNVKQIVSLSEQLASMHPNTKLAGLEIRADKADPHYYNVKYTLSSLSLPIKEAPANNKSQPGRRR